MRYIWAAEVFVADGKGKGLEIISTVRWFAFDSQLFWYKCVFMTELLLSEFFFTFRLSRRSRFPLRLFLCITGCYVLAFLFPVMYDGALQTSLMFFVLFSVTVAAIKICFDESWLNVIFCAIAGYSMQHFAYTLNNLAVRIFDFDEGISAGVYGQAPAPVNERMIISYIVSYYLTYWLGFLLFASRIKRYERFIVTNRNIMFLSALIVIVDIVFNAIVVNALGEDVKKIFVIIIYCYGLMSCFLSLTLQFRIMGSNKLQSELDTAKSLWYEKRELYEISRENIDIINVKCHDLKHQIRALRGGADEKELAEIERAIGIYDSAVKTGNEALDVILTEKSLYCEKNGIVLSCIADGEKLSFMSNPDIYSLFGNAMDNAIESVLKIADVTRRSVSIMVKSVGNILSVHVENSYDGEIKFEDGLPQTTKKDKKYHGFGIKSMKMTAEKYGGHLKTSASDGIFSLDIIFSLKD